MKRLAAPLAVIAAAVVGCAELSTDPNVVASLQFDGVPYPAVITGDSLRDADGVAAPLRATAYNGSGGIIAAPALQYLALDTGVTISAEGFLVATRREGFVRVVAVANGLQTLPQRIEVTRRPDSLFTTGAAVISYQYLIPDAATNVTPALQVTVQSDDVAGGLTPNVAGWLVRWSVIHDGDTLAATETTLVSLREGTRRSLLDTTGTDGTSSRVLRIFANALPTLADSFIVVAEVRRHGVLLRGSPVRFVVNVAPQ